MHEFSPGAKYYRIAEEQANHQFSKGKASLAEIGVMACVEVPALHFGPTSPLVIPLLTQCAFHITIAPAHSYVRPVINPFTFLKHPHSVAPFVIQAKVIDDSSRMRIREIEVE